VALADPLGLIGSKFFERVSTLNDLTARDHVESDPLDLDHLSTRTG
jgi:hypothetical protein